MAQKFSFLIVVEDNGSIKGKAYKREDAAQGLEDFDKVRSAGKEAHFFQHPNPDKRCKSAVAQKATAEATAQPSPAAKAE